MLNILKTLIVLSGVIFVNSCSSGNSRNYQDEDYQTESSQTRYTSLKFHSPSDVKVELSHQTFRDDSGNSISFGGSASNVYVNGTAWGGAVSVEEFGKNSDGFPYAVFSFDTPYGETTWIITQTYRSIYIFDVRDPQTLYYKQ